jgi:hypothetical protein
MTGALTTFLNVDLDIVSARPLEPLVAAFGRSVIVHHVGREGGRHTAHLSLAVDRQSADARIRALIRLIRRLPPPARHLWNRAISREFNIGIQAGTSPFSYLVTLEAETVRSIADVSGRIGITTYAIEAPARRRARCRRGPRGNPQVSFTNR